MIPESTTLRTGGPATTDRRDQMVRIAREAFLTQGYAGTTMSSIAARLGGSKTTLWTYFRSKEVLFAAVVDNIVEQYGTALSVALPNDRPVEEVLRTFGAALLKTILSEPIIALHRMVTGEAGRFPELAQMFYDRGPQRGKAKLMAYFAAAMDRGALVAGNAEDAARHFAAMCQSGCYQQAVLGLVSAPSQEQISHDLDSAVQCFMRAWGPPETS